MISGNIPTCCAARAARPSRCASSSRATPTRCRTISASLSTRSRYNRFFGAMSELPPTAARALHPCRRGRPIQRGRHHAGRWHRDHRRRSALRLRFRDRQLRVRPVDRRPLAGPRHRQGADEESGMPRGGLRRRTNCSATRCAPTRPCSALARSPATCSATAPATGSWCASKSRSTSLRRTFPAPAGGSPPRCPPVFLRPRGDRVDATGPGSCGNRTGLLVYASRARQSISP